MRAHEMRDLSTDDADFRRFFFIVRVAHVQISVNLRHPWTKFPDETRFCV